MPVDEPIPVSGNSTPRTRLSANRDRFASSSLNSVQPRWFSRRYAASNRMARRARRSSHWARRIVASPGTADDQPPKNGPAQTPCVTMPHVRDPGLNRRPIQLRRQGAGQHPIAFRLETTPGIHGLAALIAQLGGARDQVVKREGAVLHALRHTEALAFGKLGRMLQQPHQQIVRPGEDG